MKGEDKMEKVWDKANCNGNVLKITKGELIELTGITEKEIEEGKKRGEMNTRGPWSIPVSYKALAMSNIYTLNSSKL